MRIVLLALLLVALVYSADAAVFKEKVFDAFAYEDKLYVTSNNQTFSVDFSGENKVVVSLDGGSFVVSAGDCVQQAGYNVCFDNFTFSHWDRNVTNTRVYKAKLAIDAYIAKVNLTRIAPSELLLGRQFTVISVMQNVGEASASSVFFQDSYPAEFDVSLVSDCQIAGNNVSWRGELAAGEAVKCSYILRPKSNVSFSSVARVEYMNGIGFAREESSASIMVPDYPIKAGFSASNLSPEVGEEITVNFSLSSSKNLSVAYSVDVGSGLIPVKTDNSLSADGRFFSFNGKMLENEVRVFQNKFAVEKAGLIPVSSSAEFSVDGLQQKFESSVFVNGSLKPLYVRVGRQSLPSGSRLSVFVINPANKPLVDLRLELHGLVEANESVLRIEGLSHKEFDYVVDAADGSYNLTSLVRYKSLFGQSFAYSSVEPVSVASAAAEQNVSASRPSAPVESEPVRVDFSAGVRRTNRIFFVLAGVILFVVLLGVVVAKLRKKPGPPPAQSPTPSAGDSDDPLYEVRESLK
ncbi:MAG: hypothetical protein HY544_02265 [Candidatus Diapherotrites archaeon]|uniref:DUF11 domain-containing protein n=1 Tax=Candidatus Iainarchaeum sp. TaxID=3101447 RepID=A0A8T3YQ70_9ARCH|nr:hypothetical protein [Candidatus Diapherotrites archaeon]